MSDLHKSKRYDLIDMFNDTSRYLDDIFTIDNPEFQKHIPDIYPAELQLNKAKSADNETSFLDLNIKVICSGIHTSVYDKRDDFGFSIVNFPWLSLAVPRLSSYGIYIAQLVRFARCCTSVFDFNENLSSKVALLKRIKQFLPLHYRKMYFNAYILPSIDYCLTIWGNAPKCHLDRILKFQKYAARIILDAPPDSPSEPLFKKLGWLNIYERVQYNKAILLYKAVHGMTPGYISELFSFSQNYNLRSFDNFDMVIPKHNREFFKNTFQYSGANIWNNLPVNLRTSSSLAAFKNALYKVIVSNR